MLNHLIEQKEEEKAWQMWVSVYPDMDKNSFIPFSKFYEKSKIAKIPKQQKTAKELLEQAEKIRKSLGK